jgi:hypothetical protein
MYVMLICADFVSHHNAAPNRQSYPIQKVKRSKSKLKRQVRISW